LQVETKLSVGTAVYSSPDVLLFIYSTDELLFMNSSQVRKFQKFHSISCYLFTIAAQLPAHDQ